MHRQSDMPKTPESTMKNMNFPYNQTHMSPKVRGEGFINVLIAIFSILNRI